MLAGTPGVELKWPPELIEVTDAGVPLICPFAAGVRKTSPPRTRVSTATVAEFSPITCESYPSFQTMAQPPEQKTQPCYLEAPGGLHGLSIFCQLLSD